MWVLMFTVFLLAHPPAVATSMHDFESRESCEEAGSRMQVLVEDASKGWSILRKASFLCTRK